MGHAAGQRLPRAASRSMSAKKHKSRHSGDELNSVLEVSQKELNAIIDRGRLAPLGPEDQETLRKSSTNTSRHAAVCCFSSW